MREHLAARLVSAVVALATLTQCRPKPGDENLNSAEVLGIVCGEREAPALQRSCKGGDCVVKGHVLGKEIAYHWLDDGDLESANLLLKDTWPVPRFEPVHLPPPLTWTEDPYGEKFWRYVFYGMRPTAHLLWAFRQTGDRRYRDKLLSILQSFEKDGKESPFSWDKHGTAYRAMTLVNTYWKLMHAKALSDAEAQMLERLIRADAHFLEDPKHFESGFNHGFAEAAALLLIAENFPDWAESGAWRDLALSRYAGLVKNIIGPDGFIIENSAYYQFYVLTQLYQLDQWAQANGVPLPPEVTPALERMVRFASYVVQPDGHIPLLGASQDLNVRKHQPELLAQLGHGYPEFGHMLSAGMCGTPPAERLVLFDSAGVAVLRSSFDAAADYQAQTHVVFDMGPYRTDHSHLDALNVILYSAGRTLLTDSGMFTEEPGPEKDYFGSTRAHNTITVDGLDQAMGAARRDLSAQGGTWLYQSGSHTLYEGVGHWRAVVLLERDVVLVLDRLTADAPHRFEQRWHLPPDLQATFDGTSATATDEAGRRVLQVTQALPDGLSASSVRGSGDPLDGWYSAHYEKREEATTLIYPREGDGATYATLFTSGPHVTAPARVAARPLPDGLEARVCAAGRLHHLQVQKPGEPDESVTVTTTPAACDREDSVAWPPEPAAP